MSRVLFWWGYVKFLLISKILKNWIQTKNIEIKNYQKIRKVNKKQMEIINQ